MMRVVLISTYDLGRQPFALASPAAWLRRAGADVASLDLSRQRLDADAVGRATHVAFSLPMHTATRLSLPVVPRVRRLNPHAHLAAFGLYAPVNASWLAELGFEAFFGAEPEAALVEWALGRDGPAVAPVAGASAVPRLALVTPDRAGLPPPVKYATLQIGPERRVTGYTEATRGCRHLCRHCPVVPVYQGQFRVVPVDVVLADIRQQVEQGARHITFGDPDFFNGPVHAARVMAAVHDAWPDLTYDVTIKVEHLLQQATLLPVLRETGCLFVTSAVESFEDEVLRYLDKGHTAADVPVAVEACREAGLTLSPTFVPFTPWTTIESYAHFLGRIHELGLVEHVAPIQLGIRLLIPAGSRLLDLEAVRQMAGSFDPQALAHPWRNPDPRVDALASRVVDVAGRHISAVRHGVFERVWELTREAGGDRLLPSLPAGDGARPRATVPFLNEPWYC